jgi:hypothetical protein
MTLFAPGRCSGAKRPPGLQYGGLHQYAAIHVRLISELRLYKIEQCWHLPEATPLRGKLRQCSILYRPIPTMSAGSFLESSRYRKATEPRFNSCFSDLRRKGAFWARAEQVGGKLCPVCGGSLSSNRITTASASTTTSLLAARARKFRRMCSTIP